MCENHTKKSHLLQHCERNELRLNLRAKNQHFIFGGKIEMFEIITE